MVLSAVNEVKQDDDRDHKRQSWGERKLKAGRVEGSLRNDNLAEIKDVQEARGQRPKSAPEPVTHS